MNPRSGEEGPRVGELVEAAASLDVRAHVLRDGDDPAALAREADAAALGVAGGDGSLAPVAAVAVERDLPFVCIPFGTRNHFARDVGLDRGDPIGALQAFAGRERRVDVGDLDGRAFLNNISVGLYARLVHRREHHRRRGAALAGARALGLLVAERHALEVRLDGAPCTFRVLFVGNNRYDLSLFTVGERPRLDEGCLHLYAADGWFPERWDERVAGSFELELPAREVRVAVDGEPSSVLGPGPLRLASRPGALRVLLPVRAGAA